MYVCMYMCTCVWVGKTWNEGESQKPPLSRFQYKRGSERLSTLVPSLLPWLCPVLEAEGQACCRDISNENKKVDVGGGR